MAGSLEKQDSAKGQAAELKEDSLGAKLLRELDVLFLGTVEGTFNALDDRLLKHPGETLAQAAVAGGIGFGLARLAGSTGFLRLVPPLAGVALTFGFARDLRGRTLGVASALADTWRSPEHTQANRKAIANTVGPLLVDSGLAMGPALIGASMGVHRNRVDFFERTLKPQAEESVFRIVSSKGTGSGFAITADGKIGTAFHVIDESPHFELFRLRGGKLEAYPVAALPAEDVALLQATVDPRAVLKPFKLGSSAEVGQGWRSYPAAVVGVPGGTRLDMRVGSLGRVPFRGERETFTGFAHAQHRTGLPAQVELLTGATADGGMSGGPVINSRREVVGIVRAEVQSTVDKLLNDAGRHAPIESLRRLVDMTERARVPGAVASVNEAALRLRLPESEILSRLSKGTLEGFLVPEAKSLKAALSAVTQARPAAPASSSMYDVISRSATPQASPPPVLWEWRVLLDKI
ncbi:MAG TPA: serine protease [Candidatus Obscuribacterales bacterium]